MSSGDVEEIILKTSSQWLGNLMAHGTSQEMVCGVNDGFTVDTVTGVDLSNPRKPLSGWEKRLHYLEVECLLFRGESNCSGEMVRS